MECSYLRIHVRSDLNVRNYFRTDQYIEFDSYEEREVSVVVTLSHKVFLMVG